MTDELGPLTKALCFLLLALGGLVILAVPWILVYEGWKERHFENGLNPIAWLVCASICVLEICMFGDFLIGLWKG